MQERINKHFKLIIVLLSIILIFSMIILMSVGRYHIAIADIFKYFGTFLGFNSNAIDSNVSIVLLNIRLPRILLAVMVGSSLSLAGSTYQSVFHNPLASPDIIGVSSGACFGAALAILFNLPSVMITVSAFCFSLITVVIVYFVSLYTKGSKITALILVGIMIGALFSAATSYIKLVADPDNQLPAITYWMMGSLASSSISDVILSIVPISICSVILLLIRWRINLLSLSDEEALSMGIDVGKLRLLCIILASLLTAASISVSGMIGWIGLIIPNLARKLVGDNSSKIMPLSMLMGGLFLPIIDGFARNLLPTEIPIGILNAFIGAPFFISLLIGGDHRQ